MKERPILMSSPMVRAILDGRKTQTRRIVKPQPKRGWHVEPFNCLHNGPSVLYARPSCLAGEFTTAVRCPYGAPGDRLWVRETFGRTNPGGEDGVYYYRADGRNPDSLGGKPFDFDLAWTPSIHMPRAASRITLEVTGVRVERLQEISDADAIAEGAPGYDEEVDAPPPDTDHEWSYRASFQKLWNGINGDGSWDANPWVWVVEFRQLHL
jgi:hypothetical protein